MLADMEFIGIIFFIAIVVAVKYAVKRRASQCPNCLFRNVDHARFCARCGRPLH